MSLAIVSPDSRLQPTRPFPQLGTADYTHRRVQRSAGPDVPLKRYPNFCILRFDRFMAARHTQRRAAPSPRPLTAMPFSPVRLRYHSPTAHGRAGAGWIDRCMTVWDSDQPVYQPHQGRMLESG